MNSKKNLTSYLKGLSIIAVILAHYSGRFFPGSFDFFGNHFVAIFFILSGFGNYYSLNNGYQKNTNLFDFLKNFYWKRAKRIYPLYWVWFFLNLVFDKNYILNENSVFDFLLIRLTDPPDQWFLHALIPCYIISPIIYYLIRKSKNKFPFIISIIFLLINPLMYYIDVPYVLTWVYKGYYLLPIFLFSFGMYFAVLQSINKFKKFKYNNLFLWGLFILLIIIFFETSIWSFLTFNLKYSYLISRTLFIIITLIFTYFFIKSDTNPPIYNYIKRIGMYTYSLYIFHGIFFTILNRLNIIKIENHISIIFAIILFPIFFICCGLLEELFSCGFNLKKAYIRFIINFKSSV